MEISWKQGSKWSDREFRCFSRRSRERLRSRSRTDWEHRRNTRSINSALAPASNGRALQGSPVSNRSRSRTDEGRSGYLVWYSDSSAATNSGTPRHPHTRCDGVLGYGLVQYGPAAISLQLPRASSRHLKRPENARDCVTVGDCCYLAASLGRSRFIFAH